MLISKKDSSVFINIYTHVCTIYYISTPKTSIVYNVNTVRTVIVLSLCVCIFYLNIHLCVIVKQNIINNQTVIIAVNRSKILTHKKETFEQNLSFQLEAHCLEVQTTHSTHQYPMLTWCLWHCQKSFENYRPPFSKLSILEPLRLHIFHDERSLNPKQWGH